jgi:hypothetical protein
MTDKKVTQDRICIAKSEAIPFRLNYTHDGGNQNK